MRDLGTEKANARAFQLNTNVPNVVIGAFPNTFVLKLGNLPSLKDENGILLL